LGLTFNGIALNCEHVLETFSFFFFKMALAFELETLVSANLLNQIGESF
jgi:hypothetical protein